MLNRRTVYFFGYGADREPEMIQAITGHKPRVVGTGFIHGYELRIQNLDEISTLSGNPQQLLYDTWGDTFKSYIIIPNKFSSVAGTLFRLSLRDRHAIDRWELVHMNWYRREFVTVTLTNGRKYSAETQVLCPGQVANQLVNGLNYSSYIVPRAKILAIATADRLSPAPSA